MPHFRHSKKGSALILVVILTLVLSILGTAALGLAVTENRITAQQEYKTQAYNVARSGAQAVAEYMIRDANNDAQDLIDKKSDTNSQIGEGEFEVSVNRDTTTGITYITSIAVYRGVEQHAKLQLAHFAVGTNAIFEHALIARTNIYPSGNGNKTVIIGSVAANGSIDLGKATSGELYPDSNFTFPLVVEPPKRDPAIPYDNDLGDDLDLKSENYELPSGSSNTIKYIRANYINLKNSTLTVSGSGIIHLYVDGSITLDTRSSISAENALLYIYVIGKGEVRWAGAGEKSSIFIYAPDSKLVFQDAGGNTYVFGALIGNEIELHNDITIEHNKDMVNNIDLDTTGEGVNFVGYTWVDD